jgi:hypothetical protein
LDEVSTRFQGLYVVDYHAELFAEVKKNFCNLPAESTPGAPVATVLVAPNRLVLFFANPEGSVYGTKVPLS